MLKFWLCGWFCLGLAGMAERSPAPESRLEPTLEAIRQKYALPALAGAIVTSEGLRSLTAVGVRKKGATEQVSKEDQWHLGSNTKAMTAMLAGLLVEKGIMDWQTTVAEVFPEHATQFHESFRGITVAQLLSHRAGLPANLNLTAYLGGESQTLRLRAVTQELHQTPQHPLGSFHYSNLGYIVVGAMIEKRTGKKWETLMAEEIFQPLGMKTTGFGGVGQPGRLDQPWPHTAQGDPVPFNGPAVDNPPVMGPAGRVHASLRDWAAFIADLLRGLNRDQPSLAEPETYGHLITPQASAYGLGWNLLERPWGDGMVLHHTGSNTMNFANVWVAPKKDFAVLICINQGGDQAAQASDAAASALIRHFFTEATAK